MAFFCHGTGSNKYSNKNGSRYFNNSNNTSHKNYADRRTQARARRSATSNCSCSNPSSTSSVASVSHRNRKNVGISDSILEKLQEEAEADSHSSSSTFPQRLEQVAFEVIEAEDIIFWGCPPRKMPRLSQGNSTSSSSALPRTADTGSHADEQIHSNEEDGTCRNCRFQNSKLLQDVFIFDHHHPDVNWNCLFRSSKGSRTSNNSYNNNNNNPGPLAWSGFNPFQDVEVPCDVDQLIFAHSIEPFKFGISSSTALPEKNVALVFIQTTNSFVKCEGSERSAVQPIIQELSSSDEDEPSREEHGRTPTADESEPEQERYSDKTQVSPQAQVSPYSMTQPMNPSYGNVSESPFETTQGVVQLKMQSKNLPEPTKSSSTKEQELKKISATHKSSPYSPPAILTTTGTAEDITRKRSSARPGASRHCDPKHSGVSPRPASPSKLLPENAEELLISSLLQDVAWTRGSSNFHGRIFDSGSSPQPHAFPSTDSKVVRIEEVHSEDDEQVLGEQLTAHSVSRSSGSRGENKGQSPPAELTVVEIFKKLSSSSSARLNVPHSRSPSNPGFLSSDALLSFSPAESFVSSVHNNCPVNLGIAEGDLGPSRSVSFQRNSNLLEDPLPPSSSDSVDREPYYCKFYPPPTPLTKSLRTNNNNKKSVVNSKEEILSNIYCSQGNSFICNRLILHTDSQQQQQQQSEEDPGSVLRKRQQRRLSVLSAVCLKQSHPLPVQSCCIPTLDNRPDKEQGNVPKHFESTLVVKAATRCQGTSSASVPPKPNEYKDANNNNNYGPTPDEPTSRVTGIVSKHEKSSRPASPAGADSFSVLQKKTLPSSSSSASETVVSCDYYLPYKPPTPHLKTKHSVRKSPRKSYLKASNDVNRAAVSKYKSRQEEESSSGGEDGNGSRTNKKVNYAYLPQSMIGISPSKSATTTHSSPSDSKNNYKRRRRRKKRRQQSRWQKMVSYFFGCCSRSHQSSKDSSGVSYYGQDYNKPPVSSRFIWWRRKTRQHIMVRQDSVQLFRIKRRQWMKEIFEFYQDCNTVSRNVRASDKFGKGKENNKSRAGGGGGARASSHPPHLNNVNSEGCVILRTKGTTQASTAINRSNKPSEKTGVQKPLKNILKNASKPR